MLSIRNDKPDAALDTGERIMAAAASCVVDFGVDRVTLAEIARRARVSRPTVYRRWPDTRSIVAALLTRHVTDVMRAAPLLGDDRESLVRQIVTAADLLRQDRLVMSVLHSELAPIYITERLGTSQHMLIDALAARLRVAQRNGSVRPGDPVQMATMVLLIAQSTIQSAQIVEPLLDAEALATELAYSLNGYLS
ncbi:TetR/AcrR family transcriptional regulator [Mycobacterium avium]|uniref:TetR/AcrR family transcriptional regulator n=1 Tax=Mycobacterium avium TaxID=1764 RepID=UPI001CDAA44E|nr:TetR/AcrR family transcriptional regulator [Mycobacterium avium]MCA2332536.1 TetR/AcrR family transcriptional regulator [Mycobacterium avium]MCA4731815.1 TetR/AcrR family transcriptional regulator [Mycobacterium avium subsp. hominissuis]MDO2359122.1 TetR/AcrR family transcriptional regulator [Mycobacterium avium subsp. hominissuis]UBV06956.1 TetR/AcrR family transcriptional regulator [Mycobacterium avium subsp. hominissuis]